MAGLAVQRGGWLDGQQVPRMARAVRRAEPFGGLDADGWPGLSSQPKEAIRLECSSSRPFGASRAFVSGSARKAAKRTGSSGRFKVRTPTAARKLSTSGSSMPARALRTAASPHRCASQSRASRPSVKASAAPRRAAMSAIFACVVQTSSCPPHGLGKAPVARESVSVLVVVERVATDPVDEADVETAAAHAVVVAGAAGRQQHVGAKRNGSKGLDAVGAPRQQRAGQQRGSDPEAGRVDTADGAAEHRRVAVSTDHVPQIARDQRGGVLTSHLDEGLAPVAFAAARIVGVVREPARAHGRPP